VRERARTKEKMSIEYIRRRLHLQSVVSRLMTQACQGTGEQEPTASSALSEALPIKSKVRVCMCALVHVYLFVCAYGTSELPSSKAETSLLAFKLRDPGVRVNL